MNKCPILILLLTLTACLSTSQTRSNGEFDKYLSDAKNGDAAAQYNVCISYLNGKNVRKNLAEGAKWCEMSAASGLARAQRQTGMLYDGGIGVAKNPAVAVKWYLMAANQNDAQSQHNLAVSYALGDGVKQNYSEAIRWYNAAANNRNIDSQYALAVMYERGEGVKQNVFEAIKWYAMLVKQNDQRGFQAMSRYGFMISDNKVLIPNNGLLIEMDLPY